MSRTENAPQAPAGRLEALLVAGAHGQARREARRLLADPAAPPEARARAGAVLASLAPEPLAVALGVAGALGAAALTVWLAVGGAL